jgi:hypothetical protein
MIRSSSSTRGCRDADEEVEDGVLVDGDEDANNADDDEGTE